MLTAIILLTTLNSFALSDKCLSSLIEKAGAGIVQKKLNKQTNLDMKNATTTKLQQSTLVGNVWVDTVIVDIPVVKKIGSFLYSTSFEIRDGNCSRAKSVAISTNAAYGDDENGGQIGSD